MSLYSNETMDVTDKQQAAAHADATATRIVTRRIGDELWKDTISLLLSNSVPASDAIVQTNLVVEAFEKARAFQTSKGQ